MGGQFNYWGLWLDSEFGKGECSESCTTFKNYTQLSVNKNFQIRNIEVWAVGEKPKKETVSDYFVEILKFFQLKNKQNQIVLNEYLMIYFMQHYSVGSIMVLTILE